jgi:hypothetical protein
MGGTKNFPPCFQIVAAFSRHDAAFQWIWKQIQESFGSIATLSPKFAFTESEYYKSTMGVGLSKQFALLEPWYDPAELAKHKLMSNDFESQYAMQFECEEERPLNVDPGYLSMTKLVLASTKNREHRIYLRDGIYAEVTLAFRNQKWLPMPWTYPDYQREDFRVFFHEARNRLVKQFAKS